jgi:hypothetical protein
MFMCKSHWFSLRRPLQSAIWREYRPGQERDKNPSDRYLAVQQLAVAEVAYKDHFHAVGGREDRLREVDAVMKPYLLRAMAARVLAVRAGAGDPLQDLLPKLPAVTP